MPPKRKPLESIPLNILPRQSKRVKTAAQPGFCISNTESKNQDSYLIAQSNGCTGMAFLHNAATIPHAVVFTEDNSPAFYSEASTSALPVPAALSQQRSVTSESNPSTQAPTRPTPKKATSKQSSTSRNLEGKAGLAVPQGRKKQRISATDLPQIPSFRPFEVPFGYHQARVSVNTKVGVETGIVRTRMKGPCAKVLRSASLVRAYEASVEVCNGLGALEVLWENCQDDWTGPDDNFHSVLSRDILGPQV